MNNFFTFADDATDFGLLKKQGETGVIIKATDKLAENIKKAAACQMDIMVHLDKDIKESVNVLAPHAGRVSLECGEINYVSVEALKKCIAEIGSAINEVSGFILHMPRILGAIWNDKLAQLCGFDVGGDERLYELFDHEKEISQVRSWYYTNFERYILSEYLLPQKELLQKFGKTMVLDLQNAEIQYDLMGKMVNPIMLRRNGFSLAMRGEKGSLESEFGLFGGDFVITEKYCEKIAEKDRNCKLLLIKPTRGVMERYVHGEGKRKSIRLETPALLAAIEGVYLGDEMQKAGYSFNIGDEFSFDEEMNSKYESIFISRSCLFTQREIKIIDKLKKDGIKIETLDLL